MFASFLLQLPSFIDNRFNNDQTTTSLYFYLVQYEPVWTVSVSPFRLKIKQNKTLKVIDVYALFCPASLGADNRWWGT